MQCSLLLMYRKILQGINVISIPNQTGAQTHSLKDKWEGFNISNLFSNIVYFYFFMCMVFCSYVCQFTTYLQWLYWGCNYRLLYDSMSFLGLKLGCIGNMASPLNHWDICPFPGLNIFEPCMFCTENARYYLSSKYQPYLFLTNYLSVIYKINFYELPDLILYNEVIV